MRHRVPTLLALGALLAGCAGLPGRIASPAGGADPPPDLLLVAVTGLQRGDPILDGLGGNWRSADDILATGMGSTAVLEWLDGRPAVEQLRAPRDPLQWARRDGLAVEVHVRDTALRSSPEWVHAMWGSTTPPDGASPAAAGVRVEILPRAQFDRARLEATLDEAGPATLVVVCGVPPGPDPEARVGIGGDPDAILAALRVPVLAAGPGVERLRLDGRRVLGDVLGAFRPSRTEAVRTAVWWNGHGGGILVDDGERIAIGGSHRARLLAGPGPAGAAESLVASATPHGDLLVLVRGSAEADLARLEILTDRPADWSPWALEPIDIVEQPSPRYLALDLAIEPEGDGVLLGDWAGQMVDVRLRTPLEDAPVVGAPIRDAGDGSWLGLNALRLHPWSRPFWKLTRPVDFDARRWSDSTGAGIDLLWVAEGEGPPAGVPLDP